MLAFRCHARMCVRGLSMPLFVTIRGTLLHTQSHTKSNMICCNNNDNNNKPLIGCHKFINKFMFLSWSCVALHPFIRWRSEMWWANGGRHCSMREKEAKHLFPLLFIVSLYCYELENIGVRTFHSSHLNFYRCHLPHIHKFVSLFRLAHSHRVCRRAVDVYFISFSLFIFIHFHFNRSHSHRNESISSEMGFCVAGKVLLANVGGGSGGGGDGDYTYTHCSDSLLRAFRKFVDENHLDIVAQFMCVPKPT